MCLLDFYTTQILTSTTVIIECISWLIKVTNNDDARWKPEIKFILFNIGVMNNGTENGPTSYKLNVS